MSLFFSSGGGGGRKTCEAAAMRHRWPGGFNSKYTSIRVLKSLHDKWFSPVTC